MNCHQHRVCEQADNAFRESVHHQEPPKSACKSNKQCRWTVGSSADKADVAPCDRLCTSRKGFTLLELMVVLVIVGVLIGVVGISMDNRQRQLEIEGERLAALLKLAQQEALLTGADYAVEFFVDGYQFYRWREAEWRPIGDGVFRPRQLESDVLLDLRFPEENERFLPQMEIDAEGPLPKIYFFSDGEATPFELNMDTAAGRRIMRLAGNFHGKIEEVDSEL